MLREKHGYDKLSSNLFIMSDIIISNGQVLMLHWKSYKNRKYNWVPLHALKLAWPNVLAIREIDLIFLPLVEPLY